MNVIVHDWMKITPAK